MNEIEYRSEYVTVADVSFPKRIIELVVMPYETPTNVDYHGRMIEEIVSRGAFTGVEERTRKITLNLDHRLNVESVVGRAIALHPSRQEGLIGEIKIFRTHPSGDLVLEQADEGSLGASAGFQLMVDKQTNKVKEGAAVWETRNRRRLNHLFLHHIAMTPTPAYETAEVLAVRNTSPAPEGKVATPNIDLVRGWQIEERWRALDAIRPNG